VKGGVRREASERMDCCMEGCTGINAPEIDSPRPPCEAYTRAGARREKIAASLVASRYGKPADPKFLIAGRIICRPEVLFVSGRDPFVEWCKLVNKVTILFTILFRWTWSAL